LADRADRDVLRHPVGGGSRVEVPVNRVGGIYPQGLERIISRVIILVAPLAGRDHRSAAGHDRNIATAHRGYRRVGTGEADGEPRAVGSRQGEIRIPYPLSGQGSERDAIGALGDRETDRGRVAAGPVGIGGRHRDAIGTGIGGSPRDRSVVGVERESARQSPGGDGEIGRAIVSTVPETATVFVLAPALVTVTLPE